MTFAVHGLPVARGIAIGRAVLVVSSRIDVAHYFIKPAEVETEIDRVRVARNAVTDELHRLQASVAQMGPNDTPHELAALLDVPLMLLQDEAQVGLVRAVYHQDIETKGLIEDELVLVANANHELVGSGHRFHLRSFRVARIALGSRCNWRTVARRSC